MVSTSIIIIGIFGIGLFLIFGVLISWTISLSVLIFILLAIVITYFILSIYENINLKIIRRKYEKNKDKRGFGKYSIESGKVESRGNKFREFAESIVEPTDDSNIQRPRASKLFSFRKPKVDNEKPRKDKGSPKPNRYNPI